MAQIDRDAYLASDWLGAVPLQRRRLELQHFWLIQLVHRHTVRPTQSPSARVQTRRENHHLPNSGLRGIEEELIEKSCAHSHEVGHRLHPCPDIGFRVGGKARVHTPNSL